MAYLPGGMTMWSRACALLDEAERHQRRFFELLATRAQLPSWEPPADIFVVERELQVHIALPGVRAEDVDIQLGADGLHIRAMKAPPRLARPARILRLEIPYGRIERHIELPPGRYELRERELTDGCLRIRLAGEWS